MKKPLIPHRLDQAFATFRGEHLAFTLPPSVAITLVVALTLLAALVIILVATGHLPAWLLVGALAKYQSTGGPPGPVPPGAPGPAAGQACDWALTCPGKVSA